MHFLATLLLLSLCVNLDGVKICRESQARLFTGNNQCYTLMSNPARYALAQSQCTSTSDGSLVSIMSEEEDTFITGNFSDQFPFWIGLSDRATETEFRWEDPDVILSTYNKWSPTWMQDNGNFEDCVFYDENVWKVQKCEFTYKYLCEFESCDSNDGEYCIGEEPTTLPAAFDIVPIIAVVVVLLIIVIVIVVVILLLIYLYKKQNDMWQRMCFCFSFKETKQKVHGLEQENFRLRKELGNLKNTSINLSGSHSLNRPHVISSIPDGQGGMLPTIRPPVSSPIVHPPLSTSGDPSKPGPPPLAQNTSLLQNSMNYSIRSNIVPTPLPQPNLNASITSDQIAGILWPQKADFQVPKKPSLNSGGQSIPSRTMFQSPFPVANSPFTFPNSRNPIASPTDGLKADPFGAAQTKVTQDKPKYFVEEKEIKSESKKEVSKDGVVNEKVSQDGKQ